MKSTNAVPGKPIVMKLRDDEEKEVMQWINEQSMYSDSIRYLIQKEIAENGIRNLQLYISRYRTIESIKLQLGLGSSQSRETGHLMGVPLTMAPPPSFPPIHEEAKQQGAMQHIDVTLGVNPLPALEEQFALPIAENRDNQSEDRVPIPELQISRLSEPVQQISGQDNMNASSSPSVPEKRKAKKVFGTDVEKSFAN